ncbi:CinA family protein [Microbacterium sp. G2-8]|uniref:CinA family protein n=1 Tax=Microbacterium sp. G2-8 TaxID=2842454 RepID=UPI001C8A903E|nr:nicotinamide-nucleotide amidohydrolase family protein [Microbacterium sp. G2-8]
MTAPARAAAALLDELRRRGWSVGAAESLTGGLVASRIIDVPGASDSMRGGVVAYDSRVKHALLGVDADLLSAHGPVHADVARQMAQGVRRALRVEAADADVGLSTTGIAGPDSPDGQRVGTVFVGVSSPAGDRVERFLFSGDRAEIRSTAADAALLLALDVIRDGGAASGNESADGDVSPA